MDGGDGEQSGVRERLALAGMFGATALRYWTGVFPGVCRELARWRRRAGEIANPVLRGLALEAPGKRGNIEGAAAFAVFVPRSHRNLVLRAVVAFQTAYNYLDLLAEQPGPDPAANARRLHEALLVALGRVRTQSRTRITTSTSGGWMRARSLTSNRLISPGSGRCTRCWTTSSMSPRIMPPGSTT